MDLNERTTTHPVIKADDGPAADAGILPGDIILEVNQEAVKNLGEFSRKIKDAKAGDTILLLINRKGTTLFLTLQNRK
ncbi:MAG: PDZ domain-containing protein [Desulfobacteraceae bacterium]|nr:PDZ domain-containing protein [Desulfobacteraceae bacterium]